MPGRWISPLSFLSVISKEAVGKSWDFLNASWVIFIIRIIQTESYEANKAKRSNKNEFYHICVIQYA